MLMSEDLAVLGPALVWLRERSGKTGKGVAEETGLSRYQVSRYECGRRRPDIQSILRYLDAVGADLGQLDEMIGLMRFLRQVR